jgi:glucan endo-1,3-alpha-glucosidase
VSELIDGGIFTTVINAKKRVAPVPPPPPPGQRIAGRMVFSSYLTYEYIYTLYGQAQGNAQAIATLKQDIQDAQAYGVDGFELYILNQSDQFAFVWNMFEAARQLAVAKPSQLPFMLFCSSNAGGDANNPSAWGDGNSFMYSLLSNFYNHPNYYKIGGKLVVGAFVGNINDAAWATVFTALQNNLGVGVYYCPAIQDQTNNDLGGNTFNSFAQQWVGSVSFWTGGTGDIGGTNQLMAINVANGKTAALGVNYSGSNYWSVPALGNVYFEHLGGEGPRDEWANILSMNPVPTFIREITWNDFTENYMTPADPSNILYGTLYNAYDTNRILKPHKGYALLHKYYAQWYTTGTQPTITKDQLIYFYRTSPAAMNSSVRFFDTAIDSVFVTTMLTAPATLHVVSGGQVTDLPLPAGINYSRTSFVVGAQQFSIVRNGMTIATVTGQNILSGPVGGADMEYTSGFSP